MVPSTHKAIVVSEVGKPVQLITDRPTPKPGPNQVLLKVKLAGINPHDQKVRDEGLFVDNNLPIILTNDVVGIVEAVGPGVTKYQVGDPILSHASLEGPSFQTGLQEYAINDVGAGFKIPDDISFDQAATVPTNAIASLFGLFEPEKGLGFPAPWTAEAKSFDYPNTVLLIVGGGSNCGRYAVQLAKLAGIGKIVVVGGSEEELKDYGATHVLDRHGGYDAVLDRIRAVVGDDLEYAFDAIQDLDGQILTINALSSHKKGKLARLLPLGPVDDSKVTGKKEGYQVIDVFGLSQMNPELGYAFWDHIPEFIRSGKIKPLAYVVKNGFTAENVNEVLDAYRDGKRVVQTHIHF